ncbi:hypothetical protein K3N28_05190 [Glycomyces sp. TRM65418]|uniref:hypothetical protein n=1 Tax=Glycomyces sp. TRM65418 TaxID=2867006 RepID=UPI001CE5E768|nr:hypothetical protein [Glycomyces sp. TRM65418]MCC3762463.1 hypothetical protein [Glycomyces sp. TRM65418]QZD56507.1 hypothetical protein K3N28_05150 [Glycomyces sp. TRM65418]
MSSGYAPVNDREWDVAAWSNPVTGVLVLYIVGIILYVAGLPWLIVAAIGLVAGATLTWTVHKAGFRPLGVGYTAACSVVATAWAAYASTTLTFNVFAIEATLVHLAILAGVCLPLAIVYAVLLAGEARSHQRKYLERQTVVERRSATEVAVRAAGIKGWAMTGEDTDEDRMTAEFEIAPGGTTFRQALGLIEPLELALKAPFRGAVRLEQPQGFHVGKVRLTRANRSILADLVPMPTVPAQPRSILDPLATGRFEDGEIATEVYAYQSSATIGQRDAGKSGLQNVMIDNFASCADCLIWVIDFKNGALVWPWLEAYAKGDAARPVFDWVGFTIGDVHAMLRELVRIAAIRQRGRGRQDKITPSPKLPSIRIDIDEIADLLAGYGDEQQREVIKLLIQYVRKFRSEGMDIDFFSQRATMSFLGSNAQDLLSQTTINNILRVRTHAEVFNTLGISNADLGGVDPTAFNQPGSVLTIFRDSRKAARRVFYLPTDDIPARAAHYAAWRPTLEPEAAQGASRAYTERWTNPRIQALLAAIRDDQPFEVTDTDAAVVEPVTAVPNPDSGAPAVAEPAVDAAPAGASNELLRLRAIFHDRFGPDEGEAKYLLACGKVAMRVMVNHIRATRAEAAPTRDLLTALAAAETAFTDISAKTLAALVTPYGVEAGVQIGAGPWGTNARGYRLADLLAGLDREPVADTAEEVRTGANTSA